MIETKEQYEAFREFSKRSKLNWGPVAFETIEALREVAKAADFAVFNNSPFLGQAELETAIDALPDWLTDD